MNLVGAVRALLAADSELSTLATGGIWDHDEIVAQGYGRDGLTLKVISGGTPSARPSIYVTGSATSALYPVKAQGQRHFLEVYFYDQATYTTIRAMQELVYGLLHQGRVTLTDDWYCREIVFNGNLANLRDPNLANAMLERAQYEARIIKLLED